MSDPEDVGTEVFTEEEVTSDEESTCELTIPIDKDHEYISSEEEPEPDVNITLAPEVEAEEAEENNGGEEKGDTETSNDTFHDAVESQSDEQSSEELSELSETESERPSTVRRSETPRKSRRVFTYDTVGGTPRIKRYTMHLASSIN